MSLHPRILSVAREMELRDSLLMPSFSDVETQIGIDSFFTSSENSTALRYLTDHRSGDLRLLQSYRHADSDRVLSAAKVLWDQAGYYVHDIKSRSELSDFLTKLGAPQPFESNSSIFQPINNNASTFNLDCRQAVLVRDAHTAPSTDISRLIRYAHSKEPLLVFEGKRYRTLGGRQTAFETLAHTVAHASLWREDETPEGQQPPHTMEFREKYNMLHTFSQKGAFCVGHGADQLVDNPIAQIREKLPGLHRPSSLLLLADRQDTIDNLNRETQRTCRDINNLGAAPLVSRHSSTSQFFFGDVLLFNRDDRTRRIAPGDRATVVDASPRLNRLSLLHHRTNQNLVIEGTDGLALGFAVPLDMAYRYEAIHAFACFDRATGNYDQAARLFESSLRDRVTLFTTHEFLERSTEALVANQRARGVGGELVRAPPQQKTQATQVPAKTQTTNQSLTRGYRHSY